MPKKRIRTKKKKKSPMNWKLYIWSTLALFLVLVVFLFVQDKSERITLVYPGDESVVVGVFDLGRGSITTLGLPAETQVTLAKGLGVWKIGNVWQIGENEGLSGELLRQTVIKNFAFPVAHWADSDAAAFADKRLGRAVGGVLGRYPTNLSFVQKVKLAHLALVAKNTSRKHIDLTTTGYLEKEQLIDGTDGYNVARSIPEKLLLFFLDTDFARLNTILVVDNSAGREAVDVISSTISFLGNKVALVQTGESLDFNCLIQSKNEEATAMLVLVLGCDYKQVDDLEFDVVVIAGADFL